MAFPDGLRLIIAVSGAVARKGGERMEDYNNAALLAGWAAEAAAAGGAGEWAHLIPEGGGGAAGRDVAAVAGGRAAAEGAPPRAASAASAASAIGTVPHVAPSVTAAGGEEGGGGGGRHTLASVLLRLSEQMGLPPSSGLVADEAERRCGCSQPTIFPRAPARAPLSPTPGQPQPSNDHPPLPRAG